MDNQPTRIEHLAPGANYLAIDMTAPPREVPQVVAPAPAPKLVAVVAPPAQQPRPQPQPAAPKAPAIAKTPAPPTAPPTAPTNTGDVGTLMVSAKPPCEILVDGRSTHKTTPQRALALPPGAHTITLVNKQQNLKRTVSVRIAAGQVTKLIQSLM